MSTKIFVDRGTVEWSVGKWLYQSRCWTVWFAILLVLTAFAPQVSADSWQSGRVPVLRAATAHAVSTAGAERAKQNFSGCAEAILTEIFATGWGGLLAGPLPEPEPFRPGVAVCGSNGCRAPPSTLS